MSQETQLPQRNSTSVVHVYLGWLTDHAVHRTPQNRRGCIILSHLNTLIQEVLAENGFLHEIAIQGHLRSFILRSLTGRQGVANRHIINAGLISEDSEAVATEVAENCRRRRPHSHLKRNPRKYPHTPYISTN